ncbi:MAG: exodeoxyribonuclease VII large subunit [Acidimicrobiales bacterium]
MLFRENRDRVNRLLKRHGDPIRMSDGVRIGSRVWSTSTPRRDASSCACRPSIPPTRSAGWPRSATHCSPRCPARACCGPTGRMRCPVPLRVGVVTSLGSAAHADLTTVFGASGMAFTLIEVDTAVQGQGAEIRIAAAIAAAASAGSDVVLVVRGGGSKTDLATFDHEIVARAITRAPVPVITGVGHDIDRSVADEVAHTATTTPTAAAQLIVGLVREWLHRLAHCQQRVVTEGRRALARADHRVDLARRHVVGSGVAAVERADSRLANDSVRLARSARRADTAARAQLDLAVARIDVAHRHALRRADDRMRVVEARVRALDPAVALARGWSITRTGDGRIVRSTATVDAGTTLVTRVADGTITSTIDEVETTREQPR